MKTKSIFKSFLIMVIFFQKLILPSSNGTNRNIIPSQHLVAIKVRSRDVFQKLVLSDLNGTGILTSQPLTPVEARNIENQMMTDEEQMRLMRARNIKNQLDEEKMTPRNIGNQIIDEDQIDF
jgi:hypothetical protein